MAIVKMKDGSDYLVRLGELSAATREKIVGGAIYKGADIVISAVAEEIQRLPTDERTGTEADPVDGPKRIQVIGLDQSLGIAPMRTDGAFTNVKIGFDGYNGIRTARWPNGQPNQMVARSIERGTTWMRATPFVKTAVRRVQKQAIETMGTHVNETIEKIMKKE